MMNGPIASGPASFFSFRVASFVPPASCGGATRTLVDLSRLLGHANHSITADTYSHEFEAASS